MKSSKKLEIIFSIYNTVGYLLNGDSLERHRMEIKNAVAILDEMNSTPIAIQQLSLKAQEWLKIISITLRSKVDPDKTNLEKLELGTKLVKSHNPSDILYLRGSQLLWEVWTLKYLKSRDSEFKREAQGILSNIISEWIQPAALLNAAIFKIKLTTQINIVR